MLTESRKLQIAERIREKVSEIGSYDKVAIALNRVASKATLHNMVNCKWEYIKDELWTLTAAKLGLRPEWQTAETQACKDICSFMRDAQTYSENFWFLAPAGSGKSEAVRKYREENRNVFVISCRDYTRRELIRCVATSLSISQQGKRYRELENEVIDKLQSIESPLLVFDEADKLKDDALRYLIMLYNEVPGAGFICCSTLAMKKRMSSFCNRVGGEELFSRFGRQFIKICSPDAYDVELICRANGITQKPELKRLKEKAEKFDYDLRAVVKEIKKEWIKQSTTNI